MGGPTPSRTAAPSSPKPAVGEGRECRVTLKGGTQDFSVPRNDLLLLAALNQGINYPHSCRVGTCGRCKTRLVSGRISPLVDFALSPLTNRELRDGYILACQAKVRGPIEIEVDLIDHEVVLPRSVPATVSGWRCLPGDVVDLRLTLEEPLRFEAGQYAALAASGSFVRRSFSFYDAPPDPDGPGATEVGFLVKRLPGGRFSGWLGSRDRRGTRMWLEGPFGQMGLDDAPSGEVLCVAGGTGLAPILSILADRLRRGDGTRFTVVFGVRASADLFAMDRLDRLRAQAPDRVRVLPIVSDEPAGSGWTGARGRVTDAIDDALGIDWRRASAFVCGALPMVEAVEARLVASGMPAARIHADRFQPSGL